MTMSRLKCLFCQVGCGSVRGAARRRNCVAAELFRSLSGHRAGSRRARQANIRQISLLLMQLRSM